MFTKNQAAQMLLVGFCRSWLMSTVSSSLNPGHTLTTKEMREIAEFLPLEDWQYSTPVRAYVAAQWPKLNEWLLRHEKNKSRLLSVVPQIEKLRSTGVHATRVSDLDKREQRVTQKKVTRTITVSRLAREQRESHGRSAWNVCKPS